MASTEAVAAVDAAPAAVDAAPAAVDAAPTAVDAAHTAVDVAPGRQRQQSRRLQRLPLYSLLSVEDLLRAIFHCCSWPWLFST